MGRALSLNSETFEPEFSQGSNREQNQRDPTRGPGGLITNETNDWDDDLSVSPEITVEIACIKVTDGFKTYDKTNYVLNGINLNVVEGTIYGLLGPSGCGKTTLFSCIVGMNQLDTGSIYVKANRRADIGFMPQEMSVIPYFTTKEFLVYYGRLYCMSQVEIDDRINELVLWLEIEDKDRIISKLSGGQQRRVSLAAALIHNPELLLLDEPTVGLDPVISASIWDKLVQMTKVEKKTILITTHYIEEAGRADRVGLMRGGKMLIEENPRVLRNRLGCSTLEESFLKLCHEQNSKEQTSQVQVAPLPGAPRAKLPIQEDRRVKLVRLSAQMHKGWISITRNWMGSLFCILLPTIQMIVFSLAIGHDPTYLHVAVHNQEVSKGVSCFDVTNSTRIPSCRKSLLSCYYLQHLKSAKTLIQIDEYDKLDDAINAVQINSAWAALHFPRNYSSSLYKRTTSGTKQADGVIDQSEMSTYMDKTDLRISYSLQNQIYESFLSFLQEWFKSCGWDPKLGERLINIKAKYGELSSDFTETMTTNISLDVMFYGPVLLIIGGFLTERLDGHLSRSLVAGSTAYEILIMYWIYTFLMMVVQALLIFLYLFVYLDVPLMGSTFWAAVLMFAIGLEGMFFGSVTAMYGSTFSSVALFHIGAYFMIQIVCGAVWPLEGPPQPYQTIFKAFPLSLPHESLRSICFRGWPITHPIVYLGFLITILWSCIFAVWSVVRAKSSLSLL